MILIKFHNLLGTDFPHLKMGILMVLNYRGTGLSNRMHKMYVAQCLTHRTGSINGKYLVYDVECSFIRVLWRDRDTNKCVEFNQWTRSSMKASMHIS